MLWFGSCGNLSICVAVLRLCVSRVNGTWAKAHDKADKRTRTSQVTLSTIYAQAFSMPGHNDFLRFRKQRDNAKH
eukprot:4638570-Amphidinium_carterae.1